MYEAGDRYGESARPLGTARTDDRGRFRIAHTPPSGPGSVLYVTADAAPADARTAYESGTDRRTSRGSGPVRLVAVLTGAPAAGRVGSPAITVTERTTVAAGFALAQFTRDGGIAGPWPGPRNAASVSHNLADVTTGGVSAFLAAPPNGSDTSTLRTFNSLADALAACTVSARGCDELFDAARPPGGARPRDTLQAVADIARAPATRPELVFELARRHPPYGPSLDAAPSAWTLALRYEGNRREIDGPGNIAFDRGGDAWVVNNYTYGADPRDPVCGGRQLLRLRPDGRDAEGAPYEGGGLYGAGYGVAFGPDGDVWATNFGFQGRGCPLDPDRLFRSVSQFDAHGRALSPPQGWRQGGFVQPQGALAAPDGTLWVANCGAVPVPCEDGTAEDLAAAVGPAGGPAADGASVTLIRPDGTAAPRPFTAGSLTLPWGIAVDGSDTVWVADFSGQRVTRLCGVRTQACPPGHRTGQPISPATAGYGSDGLVRNTGVQIDPSGNVWLANNWELVPVQTNPGGHQLVLFVGLATPVRTPLIGQPRGL